MFIHVDNRYKAEFPHLDVEQLSQQQKDEVIGKLKEGSSNIHGQFRTCVHQISLSFERKGVNLNQVKLILKEFHIPEISDSESIHGAITKIFDHGSLFDHSIIDHLVNVLGDEEDKEKMDTYMSDFDQYCKRRICEVPIDTLKSDRIVENRLHVKTDKTFNILLEDIKLVQQNLNQLLNTSLFLLAIKDAGCIELEFGCLEQLPLKASIYKKFDDELLQIGITKLWNNERVLYQKKIYDKDIETRFENQMLMENHLGKLIYKTQNSFYAQCVIVHIHVCSDQ